MTDPNNLFSGIMQQAKAMQDKMEKAKEAIEQAEVTGEAGAGLVKVTLNGRHEAKQVSIDPSILNEDQEMLEDLIAAAFNDAARRVEENNKKMMQDLTGGFGMPGDFKMPF